MSINTVVQYLIEAVAAHKDGHPAQLRRWATLLHEADAAKTLLALRGYGGPGMSLRAAVENVPERQR